MLEHPDKNVISLEMWRLTA